MRKAELVEQVANAVGPRFTRKDVAIVVERAIETIIRNISNGEEIQLRGFGTFKASRRRPRRGRNPRTGKEIRIPAQLVPVFKPSRIFRAIVSSR
jgi:DNA-binding protein HU-beta